MRSLSPAARPCASPAWPLPTRSATSPAHIGREPLTPPMAGASMPSAGGMPGLGFWSADSGGGHAAVDPGAPAGTRIDEDLAAEGVDAVGHRLQVGAGPAGAAFWSLAVVGHFELQVAVADRQ